ncbi:hypothetical protein SAMN03159341_11016 [Paenibacillus sp. 1_12]|uniref:hypothetical protein n=1 Tax=Paenibacillus sp. 1_12 TaxID=1566278 RepID=UPI0008E2194C|nr:hypothetical protein [Paenibacillus sp. 1_12]SFL80296.1 hypothetical protein SAMN03159341_11016 [Paenibacillus sp. 1_12]
MKSSYYGSLFIRYAVIAGIYLLGSAYTPSSAEATINLKPQYITILAETELYEDYKNPKEASASLGPLQSVKVVDVDAEWRQDEPVDVVWYLIETTWLGNMWVHADERVMNGLLQEEERSITTIFETPLYDQPNTRPSGLTLSPQKLKSDSSITYSQLRGTNAMSFLGGGGSWYRIHTWLGDKWLLKPTLVEDILETPISFDMKLETAETAYPYPYHIEAAAEPLLSQTLRIEATWDTHGFLGPSGELWYKFHLPQGERWVAPQNKATISYKPIQETVKLSVQTRYFEKPTLDYSMIFWLEPGEYEAFEASGAQWKHVMTPTGDKWVNPERALLERPIEIAPTDEDILLTLEDQTFDHPIEEKTAHAKGFYGPQTVHAFEKWDVGPSGVWYHFIGLSGNEWVKKR